MLSRTPLILAGLAAALTGPALAGPDYSPSKRGQYPSTNFNAPDADRITIHGTGSTGEIPAMTVGGAPLASLLASVPQIANGTVRLLGGPTLGLWQAGRYTATPDALITPGTVSAGAFLGDGSAIGAVPSTTAAAGTLARLLADRATAANPTLSGTLTHSGAAYSLGGGAITNTTQPDNSHVDMVAPNDRYHDNVLTIENRSVDAATGKCGNAAIRFRAINGYEKSAIGYSRLGSDPRCQTGFFPNTLYMEGGNLGPDGNPDDTDLALVMTHVAGSKNFPASQYRIFWAEGATGILRMVNSRGVTSHQYEPEAFRTTFYGSANHLRFSGAASGSAPEIAAIGTPGSDSNVDLSLRTLGTGRVLVNGTPLSAAATTAIGTSGATLPLLANANTWAGQQSFGAGVTVTGAASLLAGLNVTGAPVVSPQYAFTNSGNAQLSDSGSNGINVRVGPAGNYRFFSLAGDGSLSIPATVTSGGYAVGSNVGVSCSGPPTANYQVTNGIVTRC